jgi:hypothetical protein
MASTYRRTDSPYIWIGSKDAAGKWKSTNTGYRQDNIGDRKQAEQLAKRKSLEEMSTNQPSTNIGAEGLALTPRPIVYTKDADLGNAGRCAALLTCRISVSALTGIPSLLIKRWPGRPPRGMPHRRDDLAGSLGLFEYGAQTLARRSVKIRCSQPSFRQRQRPRCNRRITCAPWTGRSLRERQYRL